MSIIRQVRDHRNALRLAERSEENRIRLGVLTLLLGEIDTMTKRDGSEATDDVVVKVIKKTLKSLEEMKALKPIHAVEDMEIAVLSEYLPRQLSESDIDLILKNRAPKTVGEFMKFMKDHYDGSYDGRLVSTLAQEYIKKENT